MVGYYTGYSKTKVGYRVLLGDTVVTSVHVLFDKSISERSADYFCELDEATVKCYSEERLVSDFDWLVGVSSRCILNLTIHVNHKKKPYTSAISDNHTQYNKYL